MKGFLPTAIADTQVAIEEVVEMRSPRYARETQSACEIRTRVRGGQRPGHGSVKPGWQIRNTVRFRVPRR
jgi:hypothetical protein